MLVYIVAALKQHVYFHTNRGQSYLFFYLVKMECDNLKEH